MSSVTTITCPNCNLPLQQCDLTEPFHRCPKCGKKAEELFSKIGYIAIVCSCGASLTWDLEHVYGKNYSPSSITSGECPNCKKRVNVKIEVWEA